MTYKIVDNKLTDDKGNVEYHSTKKTSGTMKPSYLVIHYTAGANFAADITTLSTSDTQASCQLVLSKEGKWAQIGKLTDIMWHAGKSQWDGISGMNSRSIGIEVSCEGPVDYVRTEKNGSKVYRTWFGKELNNATTPIIDAAHKDGGPVRGWVQFTPEQIAQLLEVGQLLMTHYGLKEAVGHDMISGPRKSDPGPAMPANIYSILNGRKTNDDTGAEIVWDFTVNTTSLLNLRAEPNTTSAIVAKLKPNTKLDKLADGAGWIKVRDDRGNEGWVNSSFIKRI